MLSLAVHECLILSLIPGNVQFLVLLIIARVVGIKQYFMWFQCFISYVSITSPAYCHFDLNCFEFCIILETNLIYVINNSLTIYGPPLFF